MTAVALKWQVGEQVSFRTNEPAQNWMVGDFIVTGHKGIRTLASKDGTENDEISFRTDSLMPTSEAPPIPKKKKMKA